MPFRPADSNSCRTRLRNCATSRRRFSPWRPSSPPSALHRTMPARRWSLTTRRRSQSAGDRDSVDVAESSQPAPPSASESEPPARNAQPGGSRPLSASGPSRKAARGQGGPERPPAVSRPDDLEPAAPADTRPESAPPSVADKGQCGCQRNRRASPRPLQPFQRSQTKLSPLWRRRLPARRIQATDGQKRADGCPTRAASDGCPAAATAVPAIATSAPPRATVVAASATSTPAPATPTPPVTVAPPPTAAPNARTGRPTEETHA